MGAAIALWRAIKGFVAHRGFFLAAGLSFYFLIYLIPLLLLLLGLAGFVLSSETASRVVLQQLPSMVPVYRKNVEEVLQQVVAARRTSSALSLAGLLFVSSQLFAALRLVMNEVFAIRQGRGWLAGMVYDMLMVGFFFLLLLASFGVTEGLFWFRRFVLEPAHMPGQWMRRLAQLASFSLDVAIFFVTYRYFPSRRVKASAALAGAVLAAVLWEIARASFRWYILSMGYYDRLYGAFGFLVALVMFVYYTAAVCILGAEYAAAREGRK